MFLECGECNGDALTDYRGDREVPAVTDDTAWAQLAKDHEATCPWILTRAHRVRTATTTFGDGVAVEVTTSTEVACAVTYAWGDGHLRFACASQNDAWMLARLLARVPYITAEVGE